MPSTKCPTCGADLPEERVYEGQGEPLVPDLSASLALLVDSIVDQYV